MLDISTVLLVIGGVIITFVFVISGTTSLLFLTLFQTGNTNGKEDIIYDLRK